MIEEKIMEDKNKIMFTDDHHVWINGKQFISLDRFLIVQTELNTEIKLLMNEITRLKEENDSFRLLLK